MNHHLFDFKVKNMWFKHFYLVNIQLQVTKDGYCYNKK